MIENRADTRYLSKQFGCGGSFGRIVVEDGLEERKECPGRLTIGWHSLRWSFLWIEGIEGKRVHIS